MTVAEAVKEADIVHILVPDMQQASVYKKEIAPNLQKGAALSFSHGAAIHWKWIVPAEDRRRHHARSEGSGSEGPRALPAELRDAGAGGGREGLLGQGLGPDTRDGQGYRVLEGRASSRRRSGRRSRPTGSESRSTSAAGSENMVKNSFETPGRGGLQPRGRLLRVPPRTEAHRRPGPEIRHSGDVPEGQRDRQIRRADPGQGAPSTRT